MVANIRNRLVPLIFALAAALPAQTTLYWDTGGADDADGSPDGLAQGDGTWNLTVPHWNTDPEGEAAPGTWTQGAVAHFSSTSPDVILWVESELEVAGLTVAHGFGLVELSGPGSLTLLGDAIVRVENTSPRFVVDVSLHGTDGLVKRGDAVLVLSGANTYSGVTRIEDGEIWIRHGSALGASGPGNETVLAGGGISGLEAVRFASSMTVGETFRFAPDSFGLIAVETDYEEATPRHVVLNGGIILGEHGWLVGGEEAYNSSLVVNGVISEEDGPRNLRISDEVTLAGQNTFTGSVQVSGQLTVAAVNNGGTPGPLGAGEEVELGYESEGVTNGELIYTGPTATSDRDFRLVGWRNTLTVDLPASTLTLTGLIEEVSQILDSQTFIKDGPGALILRGNNPGLRGAVEVTEGYLILGHDHALGGGEMIGDLPAVLLGTEDTVYSDDLGLFLEDGVELLRDVVVVDENNDGGATFLGISTPGAATFRGDIETDKHLYLVAEAEGFLTFEGSLTGSPYAGFNKSGSGRVTLNGPVSLGLAGAWVQDGELRINGAFSGASGVTVTTGAVLSGLGTIEGPVAIQAGALLSPGSSGNAVGTMSVSGLHLKPDSEVRWQLGALAESGSHDLIVVATGEEDVLLIDAGARLSVDLTLLAIADRPNSPDVMLNAPFWQETRIWKVIDFSGSGGFELELGALDPLEVENSLWNGGRFDTFVGGAGAFDDFAAGDVFLRFTPVPEPSTWALLTTGALLLIARGRRWRR